MEQQAVEQAVAGAQVFALFEQQLQARLFYSTILTPQWIGFRHGSELQTLSRVRCDLILCACASSSCLPLTQHLLHLLVLTFAHLERTPAVAAGIKYRLLALKKESLKSKIIAQNPAKINRLADKMECIAYWSELGAGVFHDAIEGLQAAREEYPNLPRSDRTLLKRGLEAGCHPC